MTQGGDRVAAASSRLDGRVEEGAYAGWWLSIRGTGSAAAEIPPTPTTRTYASPAECFSATDRDPLAGRQNPLPDGFFRVFMPTTSISLFG